MYYITLKKLIVLVFIGFIAGVALFYSIQVSTVREIMTRVQTLESELEKAESETFILDEIITRNPSLAIDYSMVESEIIDGIAFYPTSGTGVILLVANNEVIGVMYTQLAKDGWFPNADQPEGEPLERDYGKVYTQTVLFKDIK